VGDQGSALPVSPGHVLALADLGHFQNAAPVRGQSILAWSGSSRARMGIRAISFLHRSELNASLEAFRHRRAHLGQAHEQGFQAQRQLDHVHHCESHKLVH